MKIFMSYAREDRGLVKTLADDLASLGHVVWFDQKLLGGQDWWEEILSQLRGCDVYVFALSPSSLDSRPCAAELDYANTLRRHLLPVQIKVTPSNFLPPPLAHAHYVDYANADKAAVVALAAALAVMGEPTPLPDPVPDPPPMPVAPLHELKVLVDAPGYIGRHEQIELLDRLEREGRVIGQEADVAELLARFRNRPDIIGDIRDRVDEEVAKIRPAPVSAPAPAPTPAPPAAKPAAPPAAAVPPAQWPGLQSSYPQPQTQPQPAATGPWAPGQYQPPPQPQPWSAQGAPATKGAWSPAYFWGMAALALVTAGIAPLIAGAISFGTPARKRQAGYLMMIGVVIFGLSLISFVSQSQSGP